MPEVKAFLKSPEHATAYENVAITWIGGHAPEFRVFEDGVLQEKIDIGDMTMDGLHQLMASKGFVRKAPEPLELLDDIAEGADRDL